MNKLNEEELKKIAGAMNLNGLRSSSNIFDSRGNNIEEWTGANNIYCNPGTSTAIILFSGNYPHFG
ncbi:MAG: hypothetical protein E7C36_11920 [Mixta calida]|nr:hypothetical protein [Mixta calida]